MKLQKKLIWTALFTTTVVALSGCIGGSSGGSGTTGSTIGLSGIVADGYLGNAKVCLDINKNKKCDDDEPSAMSEDGTGAYSLDATNAQISSAPLLVIVTTNSTDTDLNGGTVDRAYTLAAPAGKGAFISPLTTMIQAEMELRPTFTLEAAESKVKSDLGLTNEDGVNLFENFIEKSQEEDVYKALYLTAQSVARALSKVEADIERLNHAIAEDTLQRMVAEEVAKKLLQIHANSQNLVESDPNYEVNATVADDFVETLTFPDVAGLTQEDITDKDNEYDEAENAVTTAPNVLIQNDLVFMEYEADSNGTYQVGVSMILTENGAIKMYESINSWSPFWLDSVTSDQAVKEDVDHASHGPNYREFPVNSGENGSLNFISAGGQGYTRVDIQQFATIELDNKTKTLKKVIRDYKGDITKEVTFEEGDLNYQFSYTATPTVHAGNINTKTLTNLCPTIGDDDNDTKACYTINDSDLASNFSLDSAEVNAFLKSEFEFYNRDNGNAFYFEGNTMHSCEYKVDSTSEIGSAVYDENGVVCKEDTSQVIAPVKEGTLTGGESYLLVPEADFGNQPQDGFKLEYSVFIADADGTRVLALEKEIAKDDTVSVGVYSSYNLSAIKRIHGAVTIEENETEITSMPEAIGTEGFAFMQYGYEVLPEFIAKDVKVNVINKEGAITNFYSGYGTVSGENNWLDRVSTEQEVRNDTLGLNKDDYDKNVLIIQENAVSYNDDIYSQTVKYSTVSTVSLDGTTFELKDILEQYQGNKTVTFSAGDTQYKILTTSVSFIHANNINTKTFEEVCDNGCEAYIFEGGNVAFSGLYDGTSSELDNREDVIKDTFKNGEQYILVSAEYGGNTFELLVADQNGNAIRREINIEKNGLPRYKHASFYNLSAINSIHAAVTE